MNHDYAHCGNFDEKKCPKSCFRGQLVKDLRENKAVIGIPVSFSYFYGTEECSLTGKKNK